MLLNIRISLPDQPGGLGAVAAALGGSGANILSLDVLESDGTAAVDQLCVEAPAGSEELLREALEDLPGVVVEELSFTLGPSTTTNAMELAANLSETDAEDAISFLVDRLPLTLHVTWAAALQSVDVSTELLAVSPGTPPLNEVKTPWLPIEFASRLPLGDWMPRSWRTLWGARLGLGIYEVAAAPLLGTSSAIVAARRGGPRFRSQELHRLGALARIAASAAARRSVPELGLK
ncbi:MAG: ACT domain-containing protein [Actinomycetota bacterium]